jgi:predicted nucleic-acid-binding Zn-ribbon protein
MDDAHQPCPICGGSQFEFGEVRRPYYLGDALFFYLPQPNGDGGLWGSIQAMHQARHCPTCGNIQLFTHQPSASR